MRWSDGLYFHASMRHLAWKLMFLCVVTQPLGFEVVPDVLIISALRSRKETGLNVGRDFDERSFFAWKDWKFMNGTSLATDSRSGSLTLSNAGCRMTKDGSESSIV